MLMTAVRALDDEFAVAAKPTVRLPVPEAPAVMVSHAAFEAAVQEVLCDGAVTVTLPVEAVAGRLAEFALSENVGAASCVTETVCPATDSDPVRELDAVFEATAIATLPEPLGEAVEVETPIQDVAVEAVHGQPEAAVT